MAGALGLGATPWTAAAQAQSAEPADPSAAGAEPASSTPPEDARARAGALFGRSEVLYRQRDFAGAAALLEEAYAVFPEPILLYDLGRAREEHGDLELALAAYRAYLAVNAEGDDRASVELRVRALEARVLAAAQAGNETAPNHPAPRPAASNEVSAVAHPASQSSGASPHAHGDTERKANPVAIYVGVGAAGLALLAFSGAAIAGSMAQGPPHGATRAEIQHDLQHKQEAAAVANWLLVGGAALSTVSVVSLVWRWH